MEDGLTVYCVVHHGTASHVPALPIRHANALQNAQLIAVDAIVARNTLQLVHRNPKLLANLPARIARLDLDLARAIRAIQPLRAMRPRHTGAAPVHVDELEHDEQEDEDGERKGHEHAHRGPVLGVGALVARLRFLRRVALPHGFQVAVASAWGRLVERAVRVAEGVAFCVAVVADALHAFGEAALVLEDVSAGWSGGMGEVEDLHRPCLPSDPSWSTMYCCRDVEYALNGPSCSIDGEMQ